MKTLMKQPILLFFFFRVYPIVSVSGYFQIQLPSLLSNSGWKIESALYCLEYNMYSAYVQGTYYFVYI